MTCVLEFWCANWLCQQSRKYSHSLDRNSKTKVGAWIDWREENAEEGPWQRDVTLGSRKMQRYTHYEASKSEHAHTRKKERIAMTDTRTDAQSTRLFLNKTKDKERRSACGSHPMRRQEKLRRTLDLLTELAVCNTQPKQYELEKRRTQACERMRRREDAW